MGIIGINATMPNVLQQRMANLSITIANIFDSTYILLSQLKSAAVAAVTVTSKIRFNHTIRCIDMNVGKWCVNGIIRIRIINHSELSGKRF